MNNLFNIEDIDLSEDKEICEILAERENLRIERIISTGQITASDFWYDQPEDEFVTILQGDAKILIEGESETHLHKGDYLLIPAHCRHKVTYTSTAPACIWLAVFFKNN
jgi:cupin 2 domain-containing protein